jgi:primosomal protein N' (replication factor Y)
MCQRLILRIALPIPLYRSFDYLLPDDHPGTGLSKGSRVLVPFGRRQLIGFLLSVHAVSLLPEKQLKKVIQILDATPLLPDKLIELLEWTSRYYHAPLGEVFAIAFPSIFKHVKHIQKKRLLNAQKPAYLDPKIDIQETLILNEDQQHAVDSVNQFLSQFKVFLLEGVTGSGKTEVYFRLIKQVLMQGRQAMLLMPEISLTPQMLTRLQARFSESIAIFHSKLTEKQRFIQWELARTAQARIVIGTRSALFIPMPALGLIIIDEEHDPSFKQQEGLCYHGRDLALVRAQIEKIPIILGSATPALESVWNAKQGRYQLLSLAKRAGVAQLPQFQILDVRNKLLLAGLSESLLAQMKEHLAQNGQVLLFLNRRGFAPLYLCHGCGWIAQCNQCDSPMRFHSNPQLLQCHYCGDRYPVLSTCPHCQQAQLYASGHGTQKLETILKKHFPNISCVRIDTDSTQKKGQLDVLLSAIQLGTAQILIGTQMLAKGHHFPGVTLVAIIDADVGLFSANFRSLEHSAQLMIQVAGRAGRATQAGKVFIQTHHPNHPLLQQLIKTGYSAFSHSALEERAQSNWPPFSHLALLRAKASTLEEAISFLTQVKQRTACSSAQEVLVLGPVPAVLSKRAGVYYAQLLFQSKQRSALHQLLTTLLPQWDQLKTYRVRWTLDIDPLEIS